MLIIRVSPTRVHVESGSPLPSGSTAAPEVTFRLDDFWADYAVTAASEGNDQTRYLSNLADGEAYAVPWECICEAGTVTVRVFGINERGRATTLPATLQVFDSGLPGALPAPPTPSAYEQYVNAVQANADLAQAAAASSASDAAAVAEAVAAIGDIPSMRQQADAMIEEAGRADEAASAAAESATQTAAQIAALTAQAGDLLTEAGEVLEEAEAAAAAVAQADARIRALEGLTARQNKQLSNLIALHAGHETTTVTDSTLASVKTVPAGVLPYAALAVLGGQSAIVAGTLVPRNVNVILSQGTGFDVFEVPDAVLALEGYGVGVNAACFNAVDLERRRFIRRIASCDMGGLNWRYAGTGNGYFFAYLGEDAGVPVGKVSESSMGTANGLCAGYTPAASHPISLNNGCFTLGSAYLTRSYGSVAVRDDSFSGNVANFKAAVQGKLLYFEMATPVEADLSGVLSEDNLISVEAGGTVTFFANNEAVAVPSTLIYTLRSGTGSSASA